MRKTVIFALLLLIAVSVNAQMLINASTPLQKLVNAEQALYILYVDSVDEQKNVENAIRGMLEKLDPHSTYSTPKEVEAMKEPLEGSFEGIGVQFNMIEDTLVVIQPTMNGPSEKVGIVPGDRIVTVNDTAIAGVKMERRDIMKRLRGKKGTKVKLGIVRRGISGVQTFVVVRDKIPVKSIDAHYMIRPETGYVRIGNFGATTHDEFMEAVQDLQKQGMKRLVIDLQDNGGGYLHAAAMIANEFLENGEMIVYTEGRTVKRQEFMAHGDGRLRDLPVVVLTNEFTASASEILAGAMQDQDRGLVVGRRTFGKGLVQRPLEFADGSMIRLTVAHYYTPTGRCIQKPYQKGQLKDYEMDLENRLKHGELTNPDSIHFADSLKTLTLKKHRVVYGGGGIMPDYFVPLDTLQYTRFHRQIAGRSIVVNALLKYIDNHRKQLKREYATFDDFNSRYEVPQTLIDNILAEAEKQNVKPKDDEELANTLPFLKTQLKALVARDIWDMSEYFTIINEQNHIVKKALEVIIEDSN
ncbi:MAG: S41 family peptidase [Prevotella sp.]|nr:S41 family peptidase [Prevotella sp.]